MSALLLTAVELLFDFKSRTINMTSDAVIKKNTKTVTRFVIAPIRFANKAAQYVYAPASKSALINEKTEDKAIIKDGRSIKSDAKMPPHRSTIVAIFNTFASEPLTVSDVFVFTKTK